MAPKPPCRPLGLTDLLAFAVDRARNGAARRVRWALAQAQARSRKLPRGFYTCRRCSSLEPAVPHPRRHPGVRS